MFVLKKCFMTFYSFPFYLDYLLLLLLLLLLLPYFPDSMLTEQRVIMILIYPVIFIYPGKPARGHESFFFSTSRSHSSINSFTAAGIPGRLKALLKGSPAGRSHSLLMSKDFPLVWEMLNLLFKSYRISSPQVRNVPTWKSESN